MLAFFVAACSLLLDVEPDCDVVADCAPYVCNAENTACLQDCTTNAECAPGWVCERGGNQCVSQGCQPQTDPVRILTLEQPAFEYDVARLGDNYWVVVADSEGVGIAEVRPDGSLGVGSDGLEQLDETPSLGAAPVALSDGDSVYMVWHGDVAANVEDVRYFRLGSDNATAGPRVSFRGETGQNIDNLTASIGGDEVVVAWSSFLDRAQVQLVELNAEGEPLDDPVVISQETTGTSLPALGLVGGDLAFARRETNAGQNTIVASFLSDDFGRRTDTPLSETTPNLLDTVVSSGMDESLAVAWIETGSDGRVLNHSVVGEGGAIMTAGDTQEFTTGPTRVDMASAGDEFALVWAGEENRIPELFMRRFDQAGDALFMTFPVSDGSVEEAGQPRIVRSSDGYAVFWVDTAGDEPDIFYRRYRCIR